MEIDSITWEQVKELIPTRVSLYYVDYNDSLDEHMDLIQECIQGGNKDALYEKVDEWYQESPYYAFEHLDAELKSDMESKFEIDEDEAEELFELHEEDIRDEYYERDDSTVLKDLFRNTGKQAMFFDTGYEMQSESWAWTESCINKEVKNIKKALGIKLKENSCDKDIAMMVRQASYGGQLVVYFYDAVEDFIEIEEGINMLRFSNASIAIINVCNGSGDHCELKGIEFKLPFNKENLFICSSIKYSYTHSVCGMSSNWCENTNVSFLSIKTRTKKEVVSSSLHSDINRDKNFSKVYKEGSCSAGDMDINRHRNVSYINNYTCGNKCADCGTFWVD